MPLYEYLCDNCSTKFEIRRAMQEIDAPAACPECTSVQVKRQMPLVFAFTQRDSGVSALGGGCGCGDAASRGGICCQSH